MSKSYSNTHLLLYANPNRTAYTKIICKDRTQNHTDLQNAKRSKSLSKTLEMKGIVSP